MSLCDKCQKQAIIYQKYSGMHLCSSHFDEDVHRKVRESLRQTRLFGRGVRVALGLSGRKNSSTLLFILKNLFCRRKDIDFWAIIIDEGEYGNTNLEQARILAERLGVSWVYKSLSILDESATKEKLSPRGISNSRKMEILINTAQETKADVLATGHNLDDEAVDIFINYLKGDVDALYCSSYAGSIPWIKPLQRIPEKEVRLYAVMHGLYSPLIESFSSANTMHSVVKRHLGDFDSRHPGTKYSLLASREKLLLMRDKALNKGEAFK